jgi:hypothetical protein
MKHHPIHSFIAFCLIIFSSGCSKIYDPQLEIQSDILVVEAHMSDALEQYIVKLSLTTRFNSTGTDNPVSGARVWVTDDNNRNVYLYSETRQGQYSFSPYGHEVGITGHTYSLHIKTADGDDYESSPQVMVSPVLVDSVYGIKRTRTELLKSPDGSSELNVKKTYIDIIADIHSSINSTPKVRFNPYWIFEMVDYHRDIIGGPPVPPTFSWTCSENNTLAISKTALSNILPEQYGGSLLIDNLTGMNADKNLYNVIMVMHYFSLSDDAYKFYNEMNKQLSSDDALFDPITQQIEGNMKCVNEPEKKVAGLFEVASHRRVIFIINSLSENSQPVFKNVTSFHALPDEPNGQTDGIPPYWWFE